jgi:hypothetical protein
MMKEGAEEGRKIDLPIMLYSSTVPVQSILATSMLLCLHNHYRVSSECFCSGSSH